MRNVYCRQVVVLLCMWVAQTCCYPFMISLIAGQPTSAQKIFPIQMLFRALDNTNVSAAVAVLYDVVHDNEDNIIEVEALDTNDLCTTIVHFNYASIHRDLLPSPLPWPGYFAYYTGAHLTSGIEQQDTRLYVDHPENFWTDTPGDFEAPDDLIIYRTMNGVPDWLFYEYAVVTNVNEAGGYIEVSRGKYGTSARNFDAARAVVATHAQKASDRYASRSWLINMSLRAPVSPDGLRGAQWFAEHTYGQFVTNVGSDGLEFDVGLFRYDLFNRPLDCDNDLISDKGYFDGINSFGFGGQVFAKHMRTLIGPSVVFQVDGSYPGKGFRGYRYINGLELEAFPQYNQYDNFSQSFQQLLQYAENTDYVQGISYPFTKQATTVFGDEYESGAKTDYRFRVGLAAACLVGAPHPYAAYKEKIGGIVTEGTYGIFDWDEYYGGDLNQIGWLGQPNGKMQRIEEFGSDLLSSVLWTLRENSPYAADMTVSDGVYEINVTSIPDGGDHQYNQIALVSTAMAITPGQEYTLVFDAKATDEWTVGSQTFDRVPSLIRVGFGLSLKQDVQVDGSWRTYYISGVAVTNSARIEFALAEQIGMRSIKNVRCYAGGGDKFKREFENGMVILNASRTDWTVSIDNVYRRLRATPHPDTGELMAAEVNDGSFVGDSITVPAMDAVFLKKMDGYFFLENKEFVERLKSTDGASGFDLTTSTGGGVQWRLTPAGGEFYYLENMRYTNECLKSCNGGASFDLTYGSSNELKWTIVHMGDGYYYLRNKAFDFKRFESVDGATSFTLSTNQDEKAKWKFVKP